jgi:hypothetical protein
MRFMKAALCAAVLLPVLASPGMAQRHEGGREGWHGDIGHFRGRDFDHWSGGRWYNGDHFGRSGWWWIVGPSWYFYPAPVYPYPNPYVPPVVVAPRPNYWYYCPNPPGYYPYVPACPTPWQAVPAR